jgi:hypothetical protein
MRSQESVEACGKVATQTDHSMGKGRESSPLVPHPFSNCDGTMTRKSSEQMGKPSYFEGAGTSDLTILSQTVRFQQNTYTIIFAVLVRELSHGSDHGRDRIVQFTGATLVSALEAGVPFDLPNRDIQWSRAPVRPHYLTTMCFGRHSGRSHSRAQRAREQSE